MIPTLLLSGTGQLVKTVKFRKRIYVGDPVNAVRIFSHKEVDELILLDIDATRSRSRPNWHLIEEIVGEAFMPVAYGGGIRNLEDVEIAFRCGIEKVILSSAVSASTSLLQKVAQRYGRQAAVVCLPVKKAWRGGYEVRFSRSDATMASDPVAFAGLSAGAGAGELLVYSIDRDGTYSGYDLELLSQITSAVDIPVIACGGARGPADFQSAITKAGCSAVAAGSIFVFQGPGKGVLISYPDRGMSRVEFSGNQ